MYNFIEWEFWDVRGCLNGMFGIRDWRILLEVLKVETFRVYHLRAIEVEEASITIGFLVFVKF